jgi:pyrroloquinoline-quinone synthase
MTADELFGRLEDIRARWNVLEHPFYRRWSCGELTPGELALYAGQYRHAVVALVEAAARAARQAEPALRPALEAHAAEEAAHVALWDGFAESVGGEPAAAPRPETAKCARAWAGDEGRPWLETMVTLWAVESAQPAISETKRAGLLAFYGAETGPVTAYFDLHAELDREHAAHGRALLEPRVAEVDGAPLLSAAERALRSNWELLDGVEAACAARPA